MQELLDSPNVTPCFFRAKDVIIHQGEMVDYVYYLKKGTVLHLSYTQNGTEITQRFRTTDEGLRNVLGVTMIFMPNRISTGSFVAKTDCICYAIPQKVMFNYICNNPEHAAFMLQLLAEKVEASNHRFQERHEGYAANTVCKMLLDSSVMENNQLVVRPSVTITYLSNTIAVHRVTVAKIIKRLEEEGVILRQNKQFLILDKEQLQNYAEGKHFQYR